MTLDIRAPGADFACLRRGACGCWACHCAAANPLFGWIWSSWLPQPYENLWLRGADEPAGPGPAASPVSRNLSDAARPHPGFSLMHVAGAAVFFQLDVPVQQRQRRLAGQPVRHGADLLPPDRLAHRHRSGPSAGRCWPGGCFTALMPDSPALLGRDQCAVDAVVHRLQLGQRAAAGPVVGQSAARPAGPHPGHHGHHGARTAHAAVHGSADRGRHPDGSAAPARSPPAPPSWTNWLSACTRWCAT